MNAITTMSEETRTETGRAAVEINRLHHLAQHRAAEAIEHAKQAGKLLIEAKDAMPHGAWSPWLRQNVRISERQCRRYMAVAMGKPMPIRQIAKTDTVSVLPAPELASIHGEQMKPGKWMPTPGCWHVFANWSAESWMVVPSLSDGYFHISKFWSLPVPELADLAADLAADWDGYSMFDGTRRAVRADAVDDYLRNVFGMPEPASVAWCIREHPALERPFGEPARPHIQDMPG